MDDLQRAYADAWLAAREHGPRRAAFDAAAGELAAIDRDLAHHQQLIDQRAGKRRLLVRRDDRTLAAVLELRTAREAAARELDAARHALELAERAQRELPQIEQALHDAIWAADAITGQRLADLRDAISELEARLFTLDAERAALAGTLTQIDALVTAGEHAADLAGRAGEIAKQLGDHTHIAAHALATLAAPDNDRAGALHSAADRRDALALLSRSAHEHQRTLDARQRAARDELGRVRNEHQALLLAPRPVTTG